MHRAFFVDDEPLVLKLFMSMPMFLECGYINEGHSTNPVEAVKIIKEKNPDVVFTDLKMPGLSGVEMMEELKRGGYGGEFVVISAYGEFKETRRFFKMGGFDYLIKPVSEHDLETLLEKLSGKLAGKKGAAPATETPSPELNRITAYLHSHVGLKHTLEAIGEKFGLKPNYICNLFSRYLDTTFVAYMTGLRMEKAAELLKTTRKPVKEIAALCGYQDYFYFCRVFRDAYRCPPTKYREAPE